MPDFPLAVNPPQGVSYAAPLIDFSPLAQLGDRFFSGAKNKTDFDAAQAIKQGLPTDAEGNIDYAKAAQMLAQTGNLGAVSQMAQIGALTQKTLPPGYRRSAGGGYEAIPGGPADPAVISNVASAAQKPTFGVIGKDPNTGYDIHGWTDPQTKTATPSNAAPQQPTGADLSPDDFLKTLPAGRAAQIKAMVEGRMAPPTGNAQRSPQVMQLMQQAAQYDPGFDFATWNARHSGMKDFYGGGKSSEMVRSANQTIAHVGDLVGSMIDLKNSWNPTYNAVGNEFNTRVLGKGQVTDFTPNAHAVAEELSKVFKGANLSDAEIHAWEKSLGPNMSPEQQKAAVGKLLSLLNGSLNALEDKRRQSLGPAMTEKKGPLLTDESRKTLENVSKWIGGAELNSTTFRHALVKEKPAAGAAATGDPLAQAKDAIAKGADRNAVIERLKQNGINPAGL